MAIQRFLNSLVLFMVAIACLGEVHAGGKSPSTNSRSTMFTLSSPSFDHEKMIPDRFTCSVGKEEISPKLIWKNPPEDTVSYVLLFEDFQVPKNLHADGYWLHWVVFNLPADVKELAEGPKKMPKDAVIGLNSWKRYDYGGPCPPDRQHDYIFTLYALDTTLDLPKNAPIGAIKEAMEGHILDEAKLQSFYDKPERRKDYEKNSVAPKVKKNTPGDHTVKSKF